MGNVDAQRMEGISALLRSVAARHRPVQLNLEGGGVFPSKKSARVLWAGIAGDVFTLSRLANDVESSMESLGFPQENRKFKPHVTLAKPRGERSSSDDSERFCKLFATYFSPMFELNSLQLIQSQLTPSGSRYSTLDSFPLGNPI
jgi:2'-5' RNA ligase